MIYLLLAAAVLGHVIFWASIVNRLHGMAIERRWMDRMKICIVKNSDCGACLVYARVRRNGSLPDNRLVGLPKALSPEWEPG